MTNQQFSVGSKTFSLALPNIGVTANSSPSALPSNVNVTESQPAFSPTAISGAVDNDTYDGLLAIWDSVAQPGASTNVLPWSTSLFNAFSSSLVRFWSSDVNPAASGSHWTLSMSDSSYGTYASRVDTTTTPYTIFQVI